MVIMGSFTMTGFAEFAPCLFFDFTLNIRNYWGNFKWYFLTFLKAWHRKHITSPASSLHWRYWQRNVLILLRHMGQNQKKIYRKKVKVFIYQQPAVKLVITLLQMRGVKVWYLHWTVIDSMPDMSQNQLIIGLDHQWKWEDIQKVKIVLCRILQLLISMEK